MSKIEWTEVTWNPLRGCTRVSAGCDNCYAEGIAARFSGVGRPFEGVAKMVHGRPHWTGKIKLVPEKLAEPLGWKKPRTVFVNSMSDLFHEAVPDEFIDQVFAVMALTPQHTYQILTKRPERMGEYLKAHWSVGSELPPERLAQFTLMATGTPCASAALDEVRVPLPNVWLGVSVEDQATADGRIPRLLATPAAIRFVSYEPALGPVDFGRWTCPFCEGTGKRMGFPGEPEGSCFACNSNTLDWIICGGESGAGARPMDPDWARGVRDACAAAGVAFFFKQWGAWESLGPTHDAQGALFYAMKGMATNRHLVRDGQAWLRVGKKAAGRLLDGVEHGETPPRPLGTPPRAQGGES